MSALTELLKLAGAVIVAALGGYFAIEKVVQEHTAAFKRMTQEHQNKIEEIVRKAELDLQTRVHYDLISKFVKDPDNLAATIRSIALLLKMDLLQDKTGTMRRAIERHFEMSLEEIRLDQIVVFTNTREPSSGGLLNRLPDQSPSREVSSSTRSEEDTGRGSWVRLINAAVSGDASVRRSATQQLLDIIRQNRQGPEEISWLLRMLIAEISEPQVYGLSAAGRYNILYVLSQVSREQWKSKHNHEGRAQLQAALDALSRRKAENKVQIGEATESLMKQIRDTLAEAI